MFAVVLYLAVCSAASFALADSPDSANLDTGRDAEKYAIQALADLKFIDNELAKWVNYDNTSIIENWIIK